MPRLRLYAAGSNSHGQLGIDSLEDAHAFTPCPLDIPALSEGNIEIKIAAGANHSLLLIRHDGQHLLYACGSSRQGQLGTVRQNLDLRFAQIDLHETLAQRNGSTPADNPTILDIAAGWETSIISFNNRVVSLGKQSGTQSGDGPIREIGVLLSTEDSLAAVSAGPSHSVVATRAGTAYGWGASRHGQLGQQGVTMPADLSDRVTALEVDGRVLAVAIGHQHSVLLVESAGSEKKEISLLGNNRKGQLGSSDSKRKSNIVSLHEDHTPALAVYAAWNTTYVQKKDALLSFGSNSHGQLGRDNAEELGHIGHVQLPADRKLLQVSAGSEHVLCVLVDQSGQKEVWGWGWNEHGNLGSQDGSLADVKLPKLIWKPKQESERILSVHAGNGTSWIATLVD